MTDYTIVQIAEPDDAAWKAVGGGIRNFNTSRVGDQKYRNICFLLRAEDGEIAGGLIGETHWNWLYVNLLFVREELRGRGYGEQLLMRAEEQARQCGATDAYLDTFSFQAPGFYEKLGYQTFGTLLDFPPGHQRHFMQKKL